MALTKEKKQNIVKELEEKIEKQKSMIFMDFSGTKVKNLALLRKKLKEAKNELRVAKKTLMDIALKNKKVAVEAKKLTGEVGMVFGYEDELSPAKMVNQFLKTNPNVKILGGYIENKFYGPEDVTRFAELPGREQLLAGLLGSLSAPASNFVGVLSGNLRKLVFVLSQIKK
jgi:large subunit ribosomal protein L10